MKKKKATNNTIHYNKFVIIVAFFLFVLIMARVGQLSLSSEIDGVNLKTFAEKRTTQKDVLPAKRGNIYDVHGEVLAQNVYSYTLIAYLDSSRTDNPSKPRHVVDIDETARQLAPILDLEEAKIKELLSKKNVYQTEFGNKGRGLTEITKDKIVALNLPGLDFIETQKRYYPNGNFLSYTLGYAKSDENNNVLGEMGLEKYYDEELSGEDGYVIYQKDLRGYKIGNNEIREEAEEGKDIYLTIDSNIQFFVEQAIKTAASKYSFDSMSIIIADAKTGKILGDSTYPSFDPNLRDITNYLDPNVSTPYEPGSTMKIYSYMATMEAGVYKGTDLFKSGIYVTKDGTEIGDHQREGWGVISFDRGFALSSNVGAINLVKNYINSDILKEYYLKLGFGSATGISLPNENAGKINFKYETEVFNAAFGQGITTTVMQNIKALTAISNDGVLLQPYLVDRIVDPATNEYTFIGEKTELGRVASDGTVAKIKELMRNVVNQGTGSIYKLEGYDIIAKTGTAQIPTTDGTGYLKGENDVIRGFAGLYPGNDPEVIIYGIAKRPSSAYALSDVVKEIVVNVTKYLNLELGESAPVENIVSYELPSFINKDINTVQELLQSKNIVPIILGNGTRIVDQYPSSGVSVISKDKVFLITNSSEALVPDLTNWSRKEVNTLKDILKLNINFNGNGYVVSQSVPVGTLITSDIIIDVELKYKFNLEEQLTTDS